MNPKSANLSYHPLLSKRDLIAKYSDWLESRKDVWDLYSCHRSHSNVAAEMATLLVGPMNTNTSLVEDQKAISSNYVPIWGTYMLSFNRWIAFSKHSKHANAVAVSRKVRSRRGNIKRPTAAQSKSNTLTSSAET